MKKRYTSKVEGLRAVLLGVGVYHHKSSQRGASIVETALSMVLVALVAFTAIHRYGEKNSGLFGQDQVAAFGRQQVGITGDVNADKTAPASVSELQPIDEISVPVGGVVNEGLPSLR